MRPKRPDINRAKQSLSAAAPVLRRAPASTASTHRVQRARDLGASLAPLVAAALMATLVRLPAPQPARRIAWHACGDVSFHALESCAAGAYIDEPLRGSAAGRCWTSCSMRRSRRSQPKRQRSAESERASRLCMPAELPRCDRGDWERCWRGLGADPGVGALVMDTRSCLDARVTRRT